MSEQKPILSFEHQLNAGDNMHMQFSPAASRARLILTSAEDPEVYGMFDYNLRTQRAYISVNRYSNFSKVEERCFPFNEASRLQLGVRLLSELALQEVSIHCPDGYPEVAEIVQKAKQEASTPYGELECDKTYLYTATDHRSEVVHNVFRFDGFEECTDGFKTPFTAIKFQPESLSNKISYIEFTERGYEPFAQSDGRYRQKPGILVGIYVGEVTPKHFMALSTGQTFTPISEVDANTIANLCEPVWPELNDN